MIDWRMQRVWIALMLLAVAIGIGNAPVLGIARQEAARKLSALQSANDKTLQALNQLQDDIGAAEKMHAAIGDNETEKFLAPVDRLRTAQLVEHRAAEVRLSHISYTFSPEQKIAVETIGAGKQELADSQLTLQADAPTDSDIYTFFDALRRTMPGRLTLRAFSIERIGKDDAPIMDTNLHFTASAEWLSNGAAQNLAEVTK